MDFLKVFGINLIRLLFISHVIVDLLSEFRNVLWISEIKLVRKGHILHFLFFPCLNSFFENFRNRFLRLFLGLIFWFRRYCWIVFISFLSWLFDSVIRVIEFWWSFVKTFILILLILLISLSLYFGLLWTYRLWI